MKTAAVGIADTATPMENAVRGMQLERTPERTPERALETYTPLPSTTQDIARYVDRLLTPDEQSVCDMATD